MLKTLRRLQGVERAVDLDGGQCPRCVFEFAALGKAGRIKNTSPRRIAPAGNPHEYCTHPCSALSRWQPFSILLIGRRYVKIQRPEQIISVVADFVLVAPFN